jgi:hypothetical protein
MMRGFTLSIGLLIVACGVQAECTKDGTPSLTVWLSIEGRNFDRWEPVAGQIHRLRLPHGSELGIEIDPTTEEKYRALLTGSPWRGVDELVKITLFEMSGPAPVTMTSTWGGVNSKQGYGPRGGTDNAPLSDEIELWLHKPLCVTLENLKSRR